MKAFWIKVIDLAVICLILFVYQTQAKSNAKTMEYLDTLREKLGVSGDIGGDWEADAPASEGYKDGTYEGVGSGYKGDIQVAVTVADGRITKIEIVDSEDDAAYFSKAEGLTEDIIEEQTTEGVDTVSGATFSSNGILEAVADALKEAEQ